MTKGYDIVREQVIAKIWSPANRAINGTTSYRYVESLDVSVPRQLIYILQDAVVDELKERASGR